MAPKKSMSHPSLRAATGPGGWRWQIPMRPPVPRLARHESPSPEAKSAGIDWVRTLVTKGPQRLSASHLRHRPQTARSASLHLIALDASGSMRAGGRLARAKGYAAHLIEQAARAGDEVGLLCFGGHGVELLLAPGPARAAGSARVRHVGGGGGTPLVACLKEAERLLKRALKQRGGGATLLWLLTDGRTLEQPAAPPAAHHIVVVDFDDPLRPLGRCAIWAEHWQAEHRLPN